MPSQHRAGRFNEAPRRERSASRRDALLGVRALPSTKLPFGSVVQEEGESGGSTDRPASTKAPFWDVTQVCMRTAQGKYLEASTKFPEGSGVQVERLDDHPRLRGLQRSSPSGAWCKSPVEPNSSRADSLQRSSPSGAWCKLQNVTRGCRKALLQRSSPSGAWCKQALLHPPGTVVLASTKLPEGSAVQGASTSVSVAPCRRLQRSSPKGAQCKADNSLRWATLPYRFNEAPRRERNARPPGKAVADPSTCVTLCERC